MKIVKPLWILVVVSLALAACSRPPTPRVITEEVETEVVVTQEAEVEEFTEATPTPIGGELILYACLLDLDKLQVIFTTFNLQYGVDVSCIDMGSGEALERIRAEKDNPQGDVLFVKQDVLSQRG